MYKYKYRYRYRYRYKYKYKSKYMYEATMIVPVILELRRILHIAIPYTAILHINIV